MNIRRGTSNAVHVCVGLASGVALLALTATPSRAQEREWTASGTYQEIVITDCRDCGDDIGMMIACTGAGQPAQVTVHWAAVENGTDGAVVPVRITVDGRPFDYSAFSKNFEMIGYTPEFSLVPGDPLLVAMQSGRTARVEFGGQSTDISLKGSRSAIEIFKAHCGWNNLPQQAAAPMQEMMPQTMPMQPDISGGQPMAGTQMAATGGEVTIEIWNSLQVAVDYYYIDAAGNPQFVYTLQPNERVAQTAVPGLELAFGVGGEEINSYFASFEAQQQFTVATPQ